ncbi:SAF domain-containing protein [Bacillus sp. FJAT-28004]|uniref:SAF domain-containing protein n=1 Tax=Bacillus sp. FJAT-28004 TaxID=1679165 RepID=UPI0006B585D9|nr:SAF domain-containing protein [Bacillus sp. FJAT-28004]
MKKILRIWLFAVVILAGPLLLIVWTKWVEPTWGTIDVIQASKEIKRGQIIQKTDLKVEKIKAEQIVSERIVDPTIIIGEEALRTIFTNEQIVKDMLGLDELIPGSGEANMPVPNEWVLSVPGSLLRGDHISLTPVLDKTKISTGTSRNALDDDEEKEKEPVLVSEGDLNELIDIPVSYSKSGNNQEVTTEDDGRQKPSGAVKSLEIVVTENQRKLIIKYGSEGYKFLITYR